MNYAHFLHDGVKSFRMGWDNLGMDFYWECGLFFSEGIIPGLANK